VSDHGSAAAAEERIAERLRAPRAAGIAGIVFSLILVTVIVLMQLARPTEGGDLTWLADSSRRDSVSRALSLVPFAGIAFLWFIGVIRSRLGEREDRLFATVFLGSGLLFVAMLFSASAVIKALLDLDPGTGAAVLTSAQLLALQHVAFELVGTFGARMAAVFVMSVASLSLRAGALPKWLIYLGYAVALALLLTPPLSRWMQLMFPTWVFCVSLVILISSYRRPDERLEGAYG
jgi:hypothetical protein